jgi:hypothetical protein
MLTNILLGLLAYSLCVTLFLAGWMRWQDRMHAMDADMEKAFEADCKARGK